MDADKIVEKLFDIFHLHVTNIYLHSSSLQVHNNPRDILSFLWKRNRITRVDWIKSSVPRGCVTAVTDGDVGALCSAVRFLQICSEPGELVYSGIKILIWRQNGQLVQFIKHETATQWMFIVQEWETAFKL